MLQRLFGRSGLGERQGGESTGATDSTGTVHGVRVAPGAVLETVRRAFQTANQVAVGSAAVSFFVDQLGRGLTAQREQADRVTASATELAATTEEAAALARDASRLATATRDASNEGMAQTEQVVNDIRHLGQQFASTRENIEHLREQARNVQSVTEVINGVAEQTNLLALNAAIEAARAGEHGRGFAVVAAEVRNLANRSSAATREIGDMLKAMFDESQRTAATIEALSQRVERTVEAAHSIEERLNSIQAQAVLSDEKAANMASIIEQHVLATAEISEAMERFHGALRNIETDLETAGKDVLALSELAEEFSGLAEEYNFDTVHDRVRQLARHAAKQVGETFGSAVDAGQISMEDLFDRNYKPVEGTHPQKYRTRFDSFTDRILPAIQEPILGQDPHIIFAGAVDNNGYFPTHNNKFAKAMTGDYETDLKNSRTKRIFNDRTGGRCGAHTKPSLLQTYKRDTGEIMHDLSVPIYVKGRHWGGFRIGYKPDA